MTVDRVIVGLFKQPRPNCVFCHNANEVRDDEFLVVEDKFDNKEYHICKWCARQIAATYEWIKSNA